MDNTIKGIINDVSEKTGRTPAEVEDMYMGVFKFIKEKVLSLNFEQLETEEDFRKAKTNFNLPRIFKLYTTPIRVEYVKTKIRESRSHNVQGTDADDNAEVGGEE